MRKQNRKTLDDYLQYRTPKQTDSTYFEYLYHNRPPKRPDFHTYVANASDEIRDQLAAELDQAADRPPPKWP
jgi:hypothetical protein